MQQPVFILVGNGSTQDQPYVSGSRCDLVYVSDPEHVCVLCESAVGLVCEDAFCQDLA